MDLTSTQLTAKAKMLEAKEHLASSTKAYFLCQVLFSIQEDLEEGRFIKAHQRLGQLRERETYISKGVHHGYDGI